MNVPQSEKLACAFFFAAPALAYGILTGRLPAIKAMLNASDSQIGLLLLALGVSTLAGLLAGSIVIDRLGAKKILAVFTLILCAAMTFAGLALNFAQVMICCAVAGISVGLCDVAMNAQGIYLEQKHGVLCLSFLHAVSSLGGVAGAMSAAAFAGMDCSPFFNFLIVLGLYLLLFPQVLCRMASHAALPGSEGRHLLRGIAGFALWLGFLSLVCHVAEGSVGEWGSIYLHTVKGAPQQEAALAFAAFTGAMVLCRLGADKLRQRAGDFFLTFFGSLLAAAGMLLILLSPWPVVGLVGYACMGFGLGPVVPILFSRAGAIPGLTPGRASGIISVCSYAGLLLFPPFLGLLANIWGLANALWTIVACCLALALGSIVFLGQKKARVN